MTFTLGRWIGSGPPSIGETALAHGGEMGAARHEMNVGAALDQPGAKIAADAARAHDRNAQAALP